MKKNILIIFMMIFVVAVLTACGITQKETSDDSGVVEGNPTWQLVGNARFTADQASRLSLFVYEGTPYVAFVDKDCNDKISIMTYKDSSWDYVGEQGITSANCEHPSLFVYEGTPYLAYEDDHTLDVSVKKWDKQTSTWNYIGTPKFSPNGASEPQLYVSSGIPYVVFRDKGSAYSGHGTMMRWNETGTVWEPVGTRGFTSDAPVYAKFCRDNNIFYFGYANQNGSKLNVMKYSGSWESVGNSNFSPGMDSKSNFDIENGVACMSFNDSTKSGKITVMRYIEGVSTTWNVLGEDGFSEDNVSTTLLDISDGDIYCAYRDNDSSYEIDLVKWDESNATWNAMGIVNCEGFPSSDDMRLFVSRGVPYILYSQLSDSKLTLYKYE